MAIDVPSIAWYPPPGRAEMVATPGATMSGTTGSSRRRKRWLDEKSATRPWLSHAPTDSASA